METNKNNILMQQQQSSLKKVTNLTIKDVATLISLTYMRKGRDVSEKVLLFTANEVFNELKARFWYISISEFEKALKNGIYGIYGEVYEISAVTIIRWVEQYNASDERLSFIHNNSSTLKAIPQKSTITDYEKKQYAIIQIKTEFERFEKTGQIKNLGGATYNALTRYNLMTCSVKEKNEAFFEAGKEIETEKKQKHGIELKDYLARLTAPNSLHQEKVYVAKKILIKNFFAKIITENKKDNFLTQLNNI